MERGEQKPKIATLESQISSLESIKRDGVLTFGRSWEEGIRTPGMEHPLRVQRIGFEVSLYNDENLFRLWF